MTIILMGVVAVAFIAGMIWLVMRIYRASNQRIERRREAWRAGGCVGPEPGKVSAPEREDWEGGCVGGISGGGDAAIDRVPNTARRTCRGVGRRPQLLTRFIVHRDDERRPGPRGVREAREPARARPA